VVNSTPEALAPRQHVEEEVYLVSRLCRQKMQTGKSQVVVEGAHSEKSMRAWG
jgi:hypothetical protein